MVERYRNLIFLELPRSLALLLTRFRPSVREMDIEKHLTKEKADAICEKIAKGLDENKIVGTANVIAYALKESWSAEFEERRKYPLKESKSNLWLGNSDAPDKSKFLALSQQRGQPHLAF